MHSAQEATQHLAQGRPQVSGTLSGNLDYLPKPNTNRFWRHQRDSVGMKILALLDIQPVSIFMVPRAPPVMIPGHTARSSLKYCQVWAPNLKLTNFEPTTEFLFPFPLLLLSLLSLGYPGARYLVGAHTRDHTRTCGVMMEIKLTPFKQLHCH